MSTLPDVTCPCLEIPHRRGLLHGSSSSLSHFGPARVVRYDPPCRKAGFRQVNMAAVLVTGAIVTQNWPFSPLMVAIASIHYTYPWRDGQAELACIAGLNIKTAYAWMVTHPSTNWAWYRAITLIKTHALPLSQTTAMSMQIMCPNYTSDTVCSTVLIPLTPHQRPR